MRSYESGAALAEQIAKSGGLFIDEFADMPEGTWDFLVYGVDRTPCQMIAYQLEWMERETQNGLRRLKHIGRRT
ncbi:ClbS/DfsB family four-helix bundle protein [Alloscardovia criceti]|uniref:ClbS/DfsB family four-helix bundle protein n=1 Tax=Alloscardovia criceti TaxID=356828 RepID=UPI00036F4759|nr:ClbS/DfsB family four-helix bundle protein [Alloscardovia criceti]